MSFSLLSPAKPPCISSCSTHPVLCVCSIKPWEGRGERDCRFTPEDTGTSCNSLLVAEPGLSLHTPGLCSGKEEGDLFCPLGLGVKNRTEPH